MEARWIGRMYSGVANFGRHGSRVGGSNVWQAQGEVVPCGLVVRRR